MSRSSKSSRAVGHDERPWLEGVYQQRQRRTVELVKQSVDALRAAKKTVSLSSIEAKSKELDPDKRGVHRNTIIGNQEARAYYKKYSHWKPRNRSRPSQIKKASENIPAGVRLRVKVNRDVNVARQRYHKLTKTELVERLLLVEQSYAEAEEIWLRDKDEVLTWRLRAEQAEVQLKERDLISVRRASAATDNSLKALKETKGEPPTTSPPPPRLGPPTAPNPFEYFEEIEELFIRRRGKHLHLSPLDWALMERWKEIGIPLRVVLRAIGQVFDRHEAKGQRRSVKSLHYCKEEVEVQFSEWREGQVGARLETLASNTPVEETALTDEGSLPFPRTLIVEHLARCRAEYLRERDEQAIRHDDRLFATLSHVAARLQTIEGDFAQANSPDANVLEETLTELDILVGHAIREHLSPTQLAERRREAEEQLRSYRGRMEPSTYEQTLDTIMLKRLREEWGVPRLSLFYL